MKYYYYEIILRCNLASASDIIRLLIIYQYGGVYIDVDTLPYTDNIYYNLNNYIKKEGIIENDMFFLFKTACFLNKMNSRVTSSEYVGNYNAEALGVDVVRFEKIKRSLKLISLTSLWIWCCHWVIYMFIKPIGIRIAKKIKGRLF